MGGSKGGGGSTSTSEASIAPELRPLYKQTGEMVQRLQGFKPGAFSGDMSSLPGSVLDEFLFAQPQFIPQATPGQQAILGRQRQRAFGPAITPQERVSQLFSGTLGRLRPTEVGAIDNTSTLGSMRPEEAAAAGIGTGFGKLRFPEAGALNLSSRFGDLRFPEFAALQQIERFTGGEIGESPVTKAAMASIRPKVLNELALAGLGTSGAVGSDLAAAYAPIVAQEIATRAQVIPQLTQLGQQLRGGDIQAANVQASIGQALRTGDVTQAQQLITIGNAARAGNAQAAQILAQIGQAQRTGDLATAKNLAELGATLASRESALLGEAATSEEGARQLEAQQYEGITQDMLRRQQIAQQLVTGVLGGFPAISGQTVTTRGGGGATGK